MKRYCYIFLIFCFTNWSISAFGQTTDQKNVSQEIDPEKDLVHFGDIIDIDFLGSVEYDWRGTLTPEGFLNGLNFIEDPVFGLCKTETDIAAAVEKGFSKLLRSPKVSVRIIDRSKRPVSTVFGAIKKEQRFQIQRPVHLNELIVLSGGLTDRASGEIQIFRPKQVSCIEQVQKKSGTGEQEKYVQASQENGSGMIKIKIADLLKGKENPQIFSGDIITILEADPIFVVGGVNSPKSISSRNQTTVSRAIAGAGGFSKDSRPEDITIFRREGSETKVIEVSFDEIKNNADKDLALKAFDVVDVGVKGRGKSKLAPIIREDELNSKTDAALPLRIID